MIHTFSARLYAGEMGNEKSDSAARDLKTRLLEKAIEGTLEEVREDPRGFVKNILAGHYGPTTTAGQRYAVVKSMPLIALPAKDVEGPVKEELNQTIKCVMEVLTRTDA